MSGKFRVWRRLGRHGAALLAAFSHGVSGVCSKALLHLLPPKVLPQPSKEMRGVKAIPRAVPIPVGRLTELLGAHDGARKKCRHLVIVEQTLRLAKGDPFACIPAGILSLAIEQLELLLAREPFESRELRLLHLQMRRRHVENEARAQAALTQAPPAWRPADGPAKPISPTLVPREAVESPQRPADLLRGLFADSDESFERREFADTLPLESHAGGV
jgi:hypothetical protein